MKWNVAHVAWADVHNIQLAIVPFYASWLTRIEAQVQALRYFELDGTDHPSHATQARMMPLHQLAQPPRTRPATT
jgi:hypothetical protein